MKQTEDSNLISLSIVVEQIEDGESYLPEVVGKKI
ncbi:hypothetical protein F383_24436 [Gossypium arboreum]|uniref:Uncharacterized protein n=1 Tax=Gossypium arboreum TaxID=29729 RepID=A0A0B0P6U8_GOSAR|nr:hypothetical protein F383_24436 [Gossypium arboreum]